MAITETVVGIYNKFLDTNNLMELIVGVYEVNHIVKFGEDSNNIKYELLIDIETKILLEFLCHAWTTKIKATAFQSALRDWIATQQIPYHIIPKKDYEEYVRENIIL